MAHSSDDMLIIKPKRGEDGYKTFSLRISDITVKRLDEIANRTGHSRNELIGIFIDYALDHCKIDDGKK